MLQCMIYLYSMLLVLKALLFVPLIFSPAEPGDNPDEMTDIMPLRLGNTWMSGNYTWNEKGEVSERYNDSISVGYDTLISGERWFVSKREDISSYFTIRTGGLLGFSSSETKLYLI